MKLATALAERAELQRSLSELQNRLCSNATVEEGAAPDEDPAELLHELDHRITKLETLISRINYTNNTVSKDGRTITQMIARRDCLKRKVEILRGFLNAASVKQSRYARTEIRMVPAVDVPDLRRKIDRLSQELRKTDETLQELNWTTELL